MNIKIIGKCIKSTKPMLKPEQVGNSKAFIFNDEKEEYEEYDVEEVINFIYRSNSTTIQYILLKIGKIQMYCIN